jgi:hypothetical protein
VIRPPLSIAVTGFTDEPSLIGHYSGLAPPALEDWPRTPLPSPVALQPGFGWMVRTS